MFKVGARVGAGLMCAAIIALLSGGSGQAQEKDPSDNSVRMFMKYAWVLLPEKFTSPNGKTIVVDKKKPKEIDIPIEVAREAVKVGYFSAHAQLCDLMEEQQANYRTLMARHGADKWTDQQQLFIQKLHQATVMIMTGKIVFQENGDNLAPVQREAKTNPHEECTDAKRQQVKEQIATYINARPAPAAAKAAEPVKANTDAPSNASKGEPPQASTAGPAAAVSTAVPDGAILPEPAEASSVQPSEPTKGKAAEPTKGTKGKAAEPAKAKTAEPAKAKTAEPANVGTQKK
jgi:hypothetical protein